MSPRGSEFEVAALIPRLTERDFAIIDMLAQHQIATTATLKALFFNNRRIAATRLGILAELGLLERFRVPGSGAHRYALSWRGWVVSAFRRGERGPTRREAELAFHRIAFSAHRRHKEGVNEFFALLHLAAEQAGAVRLSEWLNEADATAGLIDVRPDAAGTLTWDDGRRLRFWYEHDRGTETIGRLTDMVDRYRTGRITIAQHRILLIGLPSPRRMSNFLAAAAAPHDLIVAAQVTVPLPPVSAPAAVVPMIITEPCWFVLGQDEPRSLADLAATTA